MVEDLKSLSVIYDGTYISDQKSMHPKLNVYNNNNNKNSVTQLRSKMKLLHYNKIQI